nr:hypothetical protein [uncultured bacterium]
MFAVGTSECLVDARLDAALRLATDCCQLGHYKIAGTLEHPLFAK